MPICILRKKCNMDFPEKLLEEVNGNEMDTDCGASFRYDVLFRL